MKTLTALTIALGLGLAGAAWAQQADPHGHVGPPAGAPAQPPAMGPGMMGPGMMGQGMMGQGMMGGGMMQGMMGEAGDMPMRMGPAQHIEGRIAFLRAEIGITEAQAPPWNAFAEALRKSVKSMPMMGPPRAGEDYLARLDRHEKALAAHLQAVRDVRAATQPLFAALTDEQKKKANDLLAGPMGMMGPMRHMGQMGRN